MSVRSRVITTPRHAIAHPRARVTARPLLTLLTYALALLALLVLVQTVLTWAQRRLDDLRYGVPRRVALDALVGHGEAAGMTTHVEALNLHGQIVLLEVPGGDPARLLTLPAPFVIGAGGADVVPQLALRDTDGDGHVDLLLTLRGEVVVYHNHDGAFQPPSAEVSAQP